MAGAQVLVVAAVRTAIVLFALYAGIRLVGRRHSAELHVGDILLILLLANGVQNAMTTGSGRLAVALVSAGTLIVAGAVVGALFRASAAVERGVEGRPIILVHDGKVLRRNLRREHITRDELMGQARKQGVEDLADVKLAVLEPNGSVSVVTRERD